jgi:hypothetical protein
LKIVLDAPFETNIGSHLLNSDSEVSTDSESPEYFEKFYLKFAFKKDDGHGKMSFISRKGAAFDFKERTINRLSNHIAPDHQKSLLLQLSTISQFVTQHPNLWTNLCMSLILLQDEKTGEFRALLANPNFFEGGNSEKILAGISEI